MSGGDEVGYAVAGEVEGGDAVGVFVAVLGDVFGEVDEVGHFSFLGQVGVGGGGTIAGMGGEGKSGSW